MELGPFFCGDVESDLIFLLFLGMRLSGVTLAPVIPVEKKEISVRILLFTIISFGADGSD